MSTEKEVTAIDAMLEEKEATVESKIVQAPRPFLEWKVGDTTYKLKLTTGIITRLEQGFKDSLLNAILDKGIPEINVIISVLQGALQKFHHGINSTAVEELYDQYIDEGHNVMDMLQNVIYPLMYDAGFFTKAQLDLMTSEMESIDTQL